MSLRGTRPPLEVPDRLRVARATDRPETGPRILFFTGGTALRETSQALVGYSHNSVHLVTPFDSGGSSAVLRRHFNMPAVGDLRSRLMALADRSLSEVPEIFDLFAHRLPSDESPSMLQTELEALSNGDHDLVAKIAKPMGMIIRQHLEMFRKVAGPDFDLRGASIGNLILAAGYLAHDRRIEPIVSVYSDLVRVRGKVGLVVDANLQIRARLRGGGHIIGQHLITGKEAPALTEAITELSLVEQGRADTPVRPGISASIRAAIAGADLICYPVGSFYSSLVANLLPAGVGKAVSRTPCPKVFIPNTLRDPESIGLSLSDQVRTLLHYLRADDPGAIASGDVLDHVLIDPGIAYPGCEDPARDLAAMGVQAIVTPLTSPATGAIDPHLLCRALISLA